MRFGRINVKLDADRLPAELGEKGGGGQNWTPFPTGRPTVTAANKDDNVAKLTKREDK